MKPETYFKNIVILIIGIIILSAISLLFTPYKFNCVDLHIIKNDKYYPELENNMKQLISNMKAQSIIYVNAKKISENKQKKITKCEVEYIVCHDDNESNYCIKQITSAIDIDNNLFKSWRKM